MLLFVSGVKHRVLNINRHCLIGIALSTLRVLTHLILLTSLLGTFYCYHFIDEETRHRETFNEAPEVTTRKWQSLDSTQAIWQQSPYLTYFTKPYELEGFGMEWLLGLSCGSIKLCKSIYMYFYSVFLSCRLSVNLCGMNPRVFDHTMLKLASVI